MNPTRMPARDCAKTPRPRAIHLLGVAALSLAALLALPGHAAAVPNVYVTNNIDNNLSQYDIAANGTLAAKSPATVATGTSPYIGIAVSPDGQSAYVANQGDPGVDDVSQFDVAANGTLSPKTPATVDAGMDPAGIAISPNGDDAYVVNNASNTVSQYDVAPSGTLSTKTPATVGTGTNPFGIAITPDGESVYVTNAGGGVSQYDVAADGTLSAKDPDAAAAGAFPLGIVVSPDGSSAYVTNLNSNTISQYDVDAGDGTLSPKTTSSVSTGSFPRGIAITPDGSSVYAANGGTNQATSTVSQYDVDPGDGELTAKTNATVPADSNPFAIAISPEGGSAYVTNFDSAKISQYTIDPDDGELAAMSPATVAAGTQPAGIAAAPDLVGPTTTIDSGPSGTVANPNASFTFSADETGSSFRCRLDGGAFSNCSSPKPYSGLADGGHSFRVRAIDSSGNIGTAATRNWTIDTSEPPPPAPPPTPPSNEFSFGEVKKNKKRGTAKLTVIVPGPGELVLEGKKVKEVTEAVGVAVARGAQPEIEAQLKVKARGKAKKKLKQKGKAKVKAEVTYTPTGGDPNTQSARVKLVKK